ncbi:hypothetical protein J6590_017127 [Homalodisca vitripennis]|nr:hypothetical protein J6590_017127 [Homalodisca vitripennis]
MEDLSEAFGVTLHIFSSGVFTLLAYILYSPTPPAERGRGLRGQKEPQFTSVPEIANYSRTGRRRQRSSTKAKTRPPPTFLPVQSSVQAVEVCRTRGILRGTHFHTTDIFHLIGESPSGFRCFGTRKKFI